jgi:hypothetical protein
MQGAFGPRTASFRKARGGMRGAPDASMQPISSVVMGAATAIHRFDYRALERDVAPAFRRLVSGLPVQGAHPSWLIELLSAERWAPKDRLDVTVFGACDQLRSDLAVRDDDRLLLDTNPQMTGGCLSNACPCMSKCPLHLLGQDRLRGEVLMRLFQAAFTSRCCGQPIWLGGRGQWYELRNWYAMELGMDGWTWPESETARCLATDPVLALLLRLSKRGAAIGWEDGGFGEGLLGWLDPDETARLATGLNAHPGLRSGRVPDELCEFDGYNAEQYLPEMREVLIRVLDVSTGAAADHSGVALTRH